MVARQPEALRGPVRAAPAGPRRHRVAPVALLVVPAVLLEAWLVAIVQPLVGPRATAVLVPDPDSTQPAGLVRFAVPAARLAAHARRVRLVLCAMAIAVRRGRPGCGRKVVARGLVATATTDRAPTTQGAGVTLAKTRASIVAAPAVLVPIVVVPTGECPIAPDRPTGTAIALASIALAPPAAGRRVAHRTVPGPIGRVLIVPAGVVAALIAAVLIVVVRPAVPPVPAQTAMVHLVRLPAR